MFVIVFGSVASVCWIFTCCHNILRVPWFSFSFLSVFACCVYVCVLSPLHERQTYRNISCEDLAKRCGWKIEWKWKLAHENCKQNSHCSQYIHGLYLKFSPVDCFTVTVIFVFVHVHELLQQFSKHFICMWGSVCMLFIRISLKI